MKDKKIYLALLVISLLLLTVMFGRRLFKEEIAFGQELTLERPREWNKIISEEINKKGIRMMLDGKEIPVSGKQIFMNENNLLMIGSELFVDKFQCAFGYTYGSKVMLQKGAVKAEIMLDEDFITVNNNINQMKNAASIVDGSVYIRAEVLENAFGYSCKWDISNNTLYLTDNRKGESVLPASFTYADMNKLPKVKNQGKLSTCWAFAANTALESRLLPKERFLFSVDNMSCNNGFCGTQEDGGECMRAIAYLASWKGPVLEADDPYGDGVCNYDARPVKHVQEVQIIDSKNFENIKRAVFLYGGVQTSIYTQMSSGAGSSWYYNKENNAYCYIGTNRPNHDVVIVGWDDNYPKSKFNSSLEGDGAFICMNSWGEEFGDNGLFYVSYYDSNIGMHNVVYTGIEDTDNYDKIYQTDLCGWVGQMGYDDPTAYFANVYTIEDDELLKAVSFYATGKATEYEIYIVNDYRSTASFEKMKFVQKGSFGNSGYYTVKLDTPIELAKGTQCAIIVKIKTPGVLRPVAIEYSADYYTSEVNIDDGCGYISLNGRSWEHVEESKNCNICLKMFTDKSWKEGENG